MSHMGTIYAGIDVGKTGACCWQYPNGAVHVEEFDDTETRMYDALNALATAAYLGDFGVQVLLEAQQPFPMDSKGHVFELGKQYGFLRGTMRALCIPFTDIRPSEWKKIAPGGSLILGKTATKPEKKRASLDRAKQLFPLLDIGNKDGVAEALLLMRLCQLQYVKGV